MDLPLTEVRFFVYSTNALQLVLGAFQYVKILNVFPGCCSSVAAFPLQVFTELVQGLHKRLLNRCFLVQRTVASNEYCTVLRYVMNSCVG